MTIFYSQLKYLFYQMGRASLLLRFSLLTFHLLLVSFIFTLFSIVYSIRNSTFLYNSNKAIYLLVFSFINHSKSYSTFLYPFPHFFPRFLHIFSTFSYRNSTFSCHRLSTFFYSNSTF